MKLFRITNHKKPRCQIYQPGFNASNSCWLQGKWVDVPEAEFDAVVKKHEELYSSMSAETGKQSHRGKGTALKNMTPAQRQAWESYSGEGRADIRYENGEFGVAAVILCADKPSQKTINWMRARKMKVIPRVIMGKKIENNGKGFPADLLTDDVEPVDVYKHIVKQNRDRMEEASLYMSSAEARGSLPNIGSVTSAGAAVQGLFELEESIIRREVNFDEDDYDTLIDLKDRYRKLYEGIKNNLGDVFEPTYSESKKVHNECAKHNGTFVLPKFSPDGTHEPTGPGDIPAKVKW